MIKDIFIDADVACNLKASSTEEADFLRWIYHFDENNIENCAHLVVSQKLINDWFGRPGTCSSTKKNSIAVIYEQLQKENRIVKISKQQLDDFEEKYFTQKIWDNLICKRDNSNDPYHIMAICLSNRRIALSRDENLIRDLNSIKFKSFKPNILVGRNPAEIDYINYEHE